MGTHRRVTSMVPVMHVGALVTDPSDWLFNVAHVLHYRFEESRKVIAAQKQDSREASEAGADHFNAFTNENR